MARPKKDILKTEKVTVRFTQAERASLATNAKTCGLSESELIRSAVLNVRLKPRLTDEELQLLRNLSGMANNLNQMAKGVNRGDQLYSEVKTATREIRELIHKHDH